MNSLKDTAAWATIGGIVGGGAGLLTGLDPLMVAGSLAMSAAAIGAAVGGSDEEAPVAATSSLAQRETPPVGELGPFTELEIPRSNGRFQEMVTTGRALRRREL